MSFLSRFASLISSGVLLLLTFRSYGVHAASLLDLVPPPDSTPTSVGLMLNSPRDYQVFQRSSRDQGSIRIEGNFRGQALDGDVIEARLLGQDRAATWYPMYTRTQGLNSFRVTLQASAGGWYRLELRVMRNASVIHETTVAPLGVGEVFVVAGQSNSANHGEEKQNPRSGKVTTFAGDRWQPANDPQPGASGGSGSFMPPFGDAMVENFRVPIGLVACGIGATSVREWLPEGASFPNPPTLTGQVEPMLGGGWKSKGAIFAGFVDRMRRLGSNGFRAVLWHQGESDANQKDPTRTLPGNLYREFLEQLIRDSRREIGWEAPWFVAQASYHVPGDEASPDIRGAQAALWQSGVALEGPDTDALNGIFRDTGGQGVHLSGPGLRAHAARWVEKVQPWLQRLIDPLPPGSDKTRSIELSPRLGAPTLERLGNSKWETEPSFLIGFTELRCKLPGGRHANVRTMRAGVVRSDGTERREVGATLVDDPDAWTQFVGWSPDGKQAVLARGWQQPDNAKWEEEHKTFRMELGKWSLDSCLLDFATHQIKNLTAIDRVSHYNGGLFFLPDGRGFGFTPLIQGVSKPYVMDRDGHNKRDVSGTHSGFTYGYSASPDGRFISFHQDYQVFISKSDGSHKRKVETGNPFNFGPTWSADGEWVLFVSGVRGRSHPYVVRRDGTELRKLVDLNGYPGWILFLDVPDFHEGSSDIPVWSPDGKSVFYTAQVGKSVELFRISLEGATEQLTRTPEGSLHYHAQPSPNGQSLVYGSKREGVRQLYVMDLATRFETRITHLESGYAAMWPHWQPTQFSSQGSRP